MKKFIIIFGLDMKGKRITAAAVGGQLKYWVAILWTRRVSSNANKDDFKA